MSAPALRTEAEIAELKRNWLDDPCWDIEDTEGFEAHRWELRAFRLEREAETVRKLTTDGAVLGLTLPGLARLRDLERRVAALEAARA